MDRKEEIIRLQMDVINQMTQNNLRRITDDLWGVPTLASGGVPAVKAQSGAEPVFDMPAPPQNPAAPAAAAGQPASGLLALFDSAVREAQTRSGDLLENAIECEACQAAQQLAESGTILPAAIRAGKLLVKAAIYHQDSGLVEWL